MQTRTINGPRPIKISEHRGVALRLRNGVDVFFGADREKVYYRDLLARRLELVECPDRIELQRLGAGGTVRVIGVTTAEIVSQIAGDGHRVNAESLFPSLSRVRRVNNCATTGQAFIVYANKPFVLPTDRNSRFGSAACEESITALVLPDQAGHRRIHFYERLPDGNERYINWLPLETPVRSGKEPAVYLADHLKEFRLKDIPVRIRDGKAFILYRGVTVTFSVRKDSRYYADLEAGRLFVRAGYEDRIETVRKSGARTRVLGKIAIVDSCLVVGGRRIPLDKPEENALFTIEEALPELGGRLVKLEPGKLVHALGLRFSFPADLGNFYLKWSRTGPMYCCVYRDKLLAGFKEEGLFREIGRLSESEIERNGKRQPRVAWKELMPEFRYSLDLAPGDRYYDDWQDGRLVVRTVGGRRECFADREGKLEFIGAADRSNSGNLIELFPALDPKRAGDGGAGLNLLKYQALLLAGASQPGGTAALELFTALSRGLVWLGREAELSSELKTAFAGEIRAALVPWRSHYLRSKMGDSIVFRKALAEIRLSEAEAPEPLDELDDMNL